MAQTLNAGILDDATVDGPTASRTGRAAPKRLLDRWHPEINEREYEFALPPER